MTPSAADVDRPRPAGPPPLPTAGGRRRFGPWPAVLLGAACYLNTLSNGFVYDDVYIVVVNPRVTSPASWREIWLSDWWRPFDALVEDQPFRDRLYRPLTLWTFRLNYAGLGRDTPPTRPEELSAWSFHLVNLVLHAAVCGLVWLLARRLTNDTTVAGVAGVLFAVHPVHVEAVAGIVGRAELLAALFLLLGLLALRPAASAPRWGRGLAAAAAFLAALLSKEHAICYPALAAVALYVSHRTSPLGRRQWLMQLAWLVLPLLIYFPLRYVALEHQLLRSAPTNSLLNPLVDAAPAQRALGTLTVLGHYTRLLLLPARLSSDYGLAVIDPRTGGTAMTVLGVATAGGLLLGLVGLRALRERRANPGPPSAPRPPGGTGALLIVMTLASYALISNTFLLIGVAVAERLLYWPSVPALILVAIGVVGLWRRLSDGAGTPQARRLAILGGLVVAVLGVRTVVRNADWASNVALASRDVRAYPDSALLNKGYALALMWLAEEIPDPLRQAAMLREAEQHLTRALDIHPLYAGALALRARIRTHFRETGAARADAETALLLEPANASALYVLAQLHGDPAGRQARLDALEAAARERPDDRQAQLIWAEALLADGRAAAALDHLQRSGIMATDDLKATRLMAEALTASGRVDEAIARHRRVLAADPDDWVAHANLARLLHRRDMAHRAYELDPQDLRSGLLLGEMLAAQGRTREARNMYERLLCALAPADPRRSVIQGRLDWLPPAGRP